MSTKNIPRELPIKCHSEDEGAIMAWIQSRPVSEWDSCVNRTARWKFTIADAGVLDFIVVTDCSDGTEFSPPVDIDRI